MWANIDVNETRPPEDHDSPLSFSMEGYQGNPPKAITPFYWTPGWNSVQSLNRYKDKINKNLPGGDTGVRVINPNSNSHMEFYDTIPPGFKSKQESLFLVPLHHIFGSEELSSFSQPVSELIPEPYAAMNKKESGRLGCDEGDIINIRNDSINVQLPLKLNDSIPDGIAGYPSGFNSIKEYITPGFYEFTKEEKPDG